MKRKGFTLIELLAVIIILAVIALIAIPVITNIITKARKSAFEDSMYSLVEAGELYYANYLLENNGVAPDTKPFNFASLSQADKEALQLKGSIPTSGVMTVRTDGKIQLEDVSNGQFVANKEYDSENISVTVAGSNNNGGQNSTEPGGEEPLNTLPATIDTCPNCEFIFDTESHVIGDDMPSGMTNDYRSLIEDHIYFLGFIRNGNDKIERAFACGIKGETPFCLENDKWSDGTTEGTINLIFPTCTSTNMGPLTMYQCSDNGIIGVATSNGQVSTGIDSNQNFCTIAHGGSAICHAN